MSFSIKVPCGDEVHRIVVDLDQQKIHVPGHPLELVQRYKALYELGGEPIPCCDFAVALEPGLRPGQLILPCDENASALVTGWRNELCESLGLDYWNYNLIVVPGLKAPALIGREAFHIGGRGQIIKNVAAYKAKNSVTVHHPETYRNVVGENWLIVNWFVDRVCDTDRPPDEPDPEWLETTHLNGVPHAEQSEHPSDVWW